MKIVITPHEDQPYSVMQRILDGTLSIEAPDEFHDILQIYPDDPFLHRKYGDLLRKLRQPAKAAKAYATAADLFVGSGMSLQAVVAKILQWQIEKPDHEQGRAFHRMLQSAGNNQTPLQQFWSGIGYPELVAFLRRLGRLRVPAGRTIIRVDQSINAIYFVVEGTVAEMPSPECETEAKFAGIDVEPVLLGPNDLFGDVFPLDQPTSAETEIRAVSPAELVAIPKPELQSLCQKHSRIADLLARIHNRENRDACERAWQTVRRSMRYGIPTRVECRCLPSRRDRQPWHQFGIGVDLSLGGMCVDLGDEQNAGAPPKLKGRIVQLYLDLPDKSALALSGKIVWQRGKRNDTGTASLIGIRFDTLGAAHRERIVDLCRQR